MDGLGEKTTMTTPEDQEEIDFVNGKERIKTITKWLWPLAIVMWFLINFTAALITLAVWLVATITVNIVMNKQIGGRLEASREARRAAAANL